MNRLGTAVSGFTPLALGDIRQYLGARFPVSTHVLPVSVAFLCLYLVYGRSAGLYVFSGRTLGGLVSFVLLFLQLRLVDDLVDLEVDAAFNGMPAEEVRTLRSVIVTGFCLSLIGVVVLNWGYHGLYLAVLASGTMIVAPFGLRRLLAPDAPLQALSTGSVVKDCLLAPFYEGVHLVILLYVYSVWTSVTQQSLPAAVIWSATGAFWTSYEFWKYSRYVTKPGWRPYGLEWRAARFFLVGLLGLSFICQVVVWMEAAFPWAYVVYAAAIAVLFTRWVLTVSPRVADTVQSRGMSDLIGYAFVGAVQAGMLLAILLSRRGP